MRLGTVCSTAVLLALSFTLTAAPAKNVTVTSTVQDNAASVAPFLHIQSDGLGNYVNAKTLVSQIQAIGDWELDARNPRGATRRLYVDFGQPIPGSGPGGSNPTAPPSGIYPFRVIAKCGLYGNSLLGFTAGAVKSCPLHIGIDYGGTNWALVMDPLTAVNGPFPETNWATVTCIYPTTGSSACSQWRFTPSGTYLDGNGDVKYANVAKLLESPTSGAPIDHGDFAVSFSIVLTK